MRMHNMNDTQVRQLWELLFEETKKNKNIWKILTDKEMSAIKEYDHLFNKGYKYIKGGYKVIVYKTIYEDNFRQEITLIYKMIILSEENSVMTDFTSEELDTVNSEILFRLAERDANKFDDILNFLKS